MYSIVRNYLAAETGAASIDEMKRLIAAILKTTREFPNYFVEKPATAIENFKSEIFLLSAMINYLDNHVSPTCIDRLRRDLNDRCRRLTFLNRSGTPEW